MYIGSDFNIEIAISYCHVYGFVRDYKTGFGLNDSLC
jgi:hypothetical protein